MNKIERNKLIKSCHKSGKSQKEIGVIFNLSQSAVSKILIHYNEEQNKDFKDRRGAKSKLSETQKNELKNLLSNSPSDYGFHVWNKWSIQSLIKTEFGIEYHENYIYKIMRCINFTSQLPSTKDYRKNPTIVKTFKEEKIPDIKKSSYG